MSVRDDESGTVVTLPGPLFEGYITSIDLPHRYVAWPVHIDVKRQVRHEDIVLAVIDALEDLCDASIATDNPLCWTSRAQPAFGGTPS